MTLAKSSLAPAQVLGASLELMVDADLLAMKRLQEPEAGTHSRMLNAVIKAMTVCPLTRRKTRCHHPHHSTYASHVEFQAFQ